MATGLTVSKIDKGQRSDGSWDNEIEHNSLTCNDYILNIYGHALAEVSAPQLLLYELCAS